MEIEQKKFNMKPELLSLLLQKGFWNNYRNKVLKTMFPEPFDKIYKAVAKFHEEHDEDLDKNKLWEIIKIDYPTLTDAQKRELAEVIQDVKDAVPWTPEFANKVLTANWKQEVFRQITEIGLKGSHGVVDSLEPIADIMEQHAPQFVPKEKFDECSMNIDELIDSDTNEKKWHFAIPELKSKLGGMHGGQFLQLMARPDCLAKGTPVLMYDGSVKAVEDIVVGDCLMGPDSRPRNVVSLSRGTADMYHVVYPWGERYTVNEDHVLSLKRSKVETMHEYGDVINVSVKEYINWPKGRKERYKGWKTGVQFNAKQHTLPPYLLGLWLGDGTSKKPEITNVDKEIVNYIKSFAASAGMKVHQRGIQYYISGGDTSLQSILRAEGVFGNKHIPDNYLLSDTKARLELLAGLIDSDGYYGGHGYEISTKSKDFADQLVFLVRSLGMHATVKRAYKTCQTGNGGYYSRVTIGGPGLENIPVRIKRKKYKQHAKTTKRNGLQFGIRVRRAGRAKYYGFTLDGDNLFVLGDFTVTHNCGKTAYIVHQVCGPEGYAKQGAVIDWYCNEEPVKRTRWRCISSWTGMPKEKLIENREHARQLFEQISKNVRTFDIPFGTPVEHIMQRTRQRKPDIVIVDQLDKLGVTSMTGGGFAGETERLRMLYVKFREIAKRTNALVIGVCQASADAEGQRFVTYDMAENSKTGKAAECDVFLGIGRAPNTGLEEDYTRWITVSKSKLDSGWKGSIVCKLIPQISRYEGG